MSAASRVLEGMLYETSPRDPIIYAGAGITLLAVTVVASLLPARRAAKADPMLALRAD